MSTLISGCGQTGNFCALRAIKPPLMKNPGYTPAFAGQFEAIFKLLQPTRATIIRLLHAMLDVVERQWCQPVTQDLSHWWFALEGSISSSLKCLYDNFLWFRYQFRNSQGTIEVEIADSTKANSAIMFQISACSEYPQTIHMLDLSSVTGAIKA